ncbi:MAG: DUF2066 domain-containing protein [Nevskiales bacterium]
MPGLYGFEVVVANSSTANRKKALNEALTQVLVRLTGERKPQDNPAARAVIEQAESFVQQFGYVQREVEPAPQTQAQPEDALDEPAMVQEEAPAPVKQLMLKGKFAKRPLDQAIREAGLPIWGAERPVLMASILVPGEGEEYLLDSSQIVAWPALESTAEERGIPFKTPAQSSLPLDVAQNPDSPMLIAHANQAEADLLLWGRLFQQQDKWILETQLRTVDSLDNPPVANWRMRSREPEPLLREAVQRSADWLAAKYALKAYVPGGESIVGLWVRGVDGEEEYRQVEDHLRRLPGVERLNLVAVVDGALVFRASTEANAEQLDENIRRSGKLLPETLPPGAGRLSVWTGEYEFHYRLR